MALKIIFHHTLNHHGATGCIVFSHFRVGLSADNFDFGNSRGYIFICFFFGIFPTVRCPDSEGNKNHSSLPE